MTPELKKYLDALELKIGEIAQKFDDAIEDMETKTMTKEEKALATKNMEDLKSEVKNMQDEYDNLLIKNDKTGTAAKNIEERKAFNVDFKKLIKDTRANSGEIPFAMKNINTREVAELGGIITKEEKDSNVIDFPQASLQFVSNIQVISISGASMTFVLEDPQFDSNFDTLTDADIDAFWTGENEDVLDNTGEKFETVKIEVHKTSILITITNEMVDDAEFDLIAYLQRKMQERFDYKQLVGFTIGTGKKSPKGFLNSERTNIVQGKVTADDIWISAINLEHGISEAYRQGSTFVMNDKTWATIKKYTDADGRPLFVRGMNLIDATENKLNGYPVVTNCAMTQDTATVGAKPIAFGNWKTGYMKVMRKVLSFIIDKVTRKGFTKLYAEGRVGGDIVSKNAIAVLEIIA